jgi:hypothetical protein
MSGMDELPLMILGLPVFFHAISPDLERRCGFVEVFDEDGVGRFAQTKKKDLWG